MAAKVAVHNNLTKRQKGCTYVVICLLSLLGGIEYSMIMPSLYLRLQNTLHAPEYFLGMILAASSFSGILASLVMGRFYDKTRKSKLLVYCTNAFELLGSLMYWIGLSPWFLVASRLVAGLGNGYINVVLAELSNGTSTKERTSVVSAVMASRQLGALIGPGLNLFLYKANFYIGPFIVDQYSSPGIFMAVMWIIGQLLVMFFYHPFTKLVSADNSTVQSNGAPDVNHNGHQVNGAINGDISSQAAQCDSISQTAYYASLSRSLSHTSHARSTDRHLPTTLERVSEASYAAGGVAMVDEGEAGQWAVTYSMKQVLQAIAHDKYMTIFMLTLTNVFNQNGIETMLSPLVHNYFGYEEPQISLVFVVFGGVILLSFFLIHLFNKRFQDRTLVMLGLLFQILSFTWYLIWIPTLQPDLPDEYTMNMAILVPAFIVHVLALPFLFVCHISLFSKLLDSNIQGIGHGLRRIIAGMAAILGPLWAGSLLHHYRLMMSVMQGLNIISLVLLTMSFKTLYVPVTSPEREDSSAEDVNERTSLLHT